MFNKPEMNDVNQESMMYLLYCTTAAVYKISTHPSLQHCSELSLYFAATSSQFMAFIISYKSLFSVCSNNTKQSSSSPALYVVVVVVVVIKCLEVGVFHHHLSPSSSTNTLGSDHDLLYGYSGVRK